MGRRKTARHVQIRPWLSARHDCEEGRFIQVGNTLLLSRKDADSKEENAFLNLSTGARFLYLCMAMESGGRPCVTFSHGAAKKYGIASSSFDRAIKSLIDAGFVTLEMDDDLAQFRANTYRFSNTWKSNLAPHFGEGQG